MNIHEIHAKLRVLEPTWVPQAEIYKSTVERYVNGDDTVLDIGCGRSTYMCDVYSRAQLVIGQDPDAQALAENTCVQIKLTGGLETLKEVKNDSVDVVVTSWVLEHIDEPDLLLSNVSRTLKSSGVFISLTPNKKSWVIFFSRLIPNFLHPFLVKLVWGREMQDTYPTRYKLNSEEEIRNFAAKYGLLVESIHFLKDPTYYVVNGKHLESFIKIYNKFVKPDKYEGLLFILKKP